MPVLLRTSRSSLTDTLKSKYPPEVAAFLQRTPELPEEPNFRAAGGGNDTLSATAQEPRQSPEYRTTAMKMHYFHLKTRERSQPNPSARRTVSGAGKGNRF